MKSLLTTLFALFLAGAMTAFAQTEAMERKSLSDLYAAGKMSLEDYQAKGKQLASIIRAEGGFPTLPYDTVSRLFTFQYVCKVPGMTKKQIMARLKECAALSYGKLAAVNEYEDVEAGKFITEGWFRVLFDNSRAGLFGGTVYFETQADCYNSFVFTVKDGAFKMEVKNLVFKFKFGGYNFYTGTFSTIYYDEKPLESMFPMMQQPEKNWGGIINLVRQTESSLNTLADIFANHVKNFEADYRF